MKALLWDIDMTLVRTGGAGRRSLAKAFLELHGWDGAMDGVPFGGQTDRAILAHVFRRRGIESPSAIAETTEKLIELYVRILRTEIVAAEYTVLPGIRETLAILAEDHNLVMGLGTGNIEQGARIKLERGDLNRYFPFGGFGGSSEYRVDVIREAADEAERFAGCRFRPSDVFVIGDTPNDVRAGKALGFRTVGVATGSDDEAALRTAGGDMVFANLAEGMDQLIGSTRTA
jgi:phosphoglycolate phosphatase-like HAD superfamily hydrolase